MPEDRHESYQLQTASGKWPGALPLQKGHVTIGGKTYPTVKMPDGSVWMAKNLELTWEGLTTLTDYSDSSTDASCAYWEFDQENYGDRGLFYNCRAFNYIHDNIGTIAPGWKLPSETDVLKVLRYAMDSENVFGFNLNVFGYGKLNTEEDNGWYVGNPGVTIDLKAYILQHYYTSIGNTIYYCFVAETEEGRAGPYFGYRPQSDNDHMPIRLLMSDPSLFVPDTTENKNARTEYTKYWSPQIVLEFSESDFDPRDNGLLNTNFSTYSWNKVSDSPNRWMVTVRSRKGVISADDPQYGLAKLFTAGDGSSINGRLTSAYMGTCTCKIVGFGNLNNLESFDRFATNCTSLTEIPTELSGSGYLSNVSQMFAGCTNVESGALDLYNYLKDSPTITNHADTFKNCGLNSQSGLAELEQIPLSWGGLLTPPSTTMTCTRQGSSSPYYLWECGSTAPDWSTLPELSVFTSSSVSKYSGVNMRRTTTGWQHNGFSTSGVPAYYRIAFFQIVSASQNDLTWVLTTTGYNGMLTDTQTQGDMPGTLSFDTYGVTNLAYGTFDSTQPVYFGFLVTNASPETWGGLTDAYGLQGNNFFVDPLELKWFIGE
jgi:uncharacterized protein (TIGR02145 family)